MELNELDTQGLLRKNDYSIYKSRDDWRSNTYQVDGVGSSNNRPDRSPSPPRYSDETPRTAPRRAWRFGNGWQSGLQFCAMIAGAVCLTNLSALIWAATAVGFENGIGKFLEGDCKRVEHAGVWIHFFINAISSILLSASNYTMQVLNSPTRQQVDAAHRSRRWLDIGIPSLRNLRSLSPFQVMLWALISLSSVPLHLLYNSVIFPAIAGFEYTYTPVSTKFNEVVKWQNATTNPYLIEVDRLKFISKTECLNIFANNYVTKYSQVYLLTDTPAPDKPAPADIFIGYIESWIEFDEVPYYWTCTGFDPDPYSAQSPVCTKAIALADADNWKVQSYPIASCAVIQAEEMCALNFSFPIMMVVISMNLCKLGVMLAALRLIKSQPLVTIGDAISEYLKDPDPTTKGMCLTSKTDPKISEYWLNPIPKSWVSGSHRWYRAASTSRWVVCNTLVAITLIAAGALLHTGQASLNEYNLSALYQLGVGAINPASFIDIPLPNLTASVVLANTPQLILSCLYLMYNSLFTSMLTGYEWSRYANSRKPLRVSRPQGQQRSTYYLQLPYKFSLPLIALSVLLHWLISQSIFLAYVVLYDHDRIEDEPIVTLGYSCIAIIFSLMVGSVAITVVNLFGIFGKYPAGIPMVGNSSLAISAACHPPPKDEMAAYKAVQWGVINDEDWSDEANGTDEVVKHCSFTSFEVTHPVPGVLYSG